MCGQFAQQERVLKDRTAQDDVPTVV